MHLSLLREYLDLEFNSMAETLPFAYDLERVIDDFVLMCLFVGNDFLPHLPNLHIAEGALSLLFKIYKKLLPTLGGYFQDSGVLDPKRVEAMFHELAEVVEHEAFEAEVDDLKYIGGKMAELLIVSSSGPDRKGKHRQGMRMGKAVEHASEIGRYLCTMMLISWRYGRLLTCFANRSDDQGSKEPLRPDQGVCSGKRRGSSFPSNT